jgi:hypothetical protein
MTLRCLALEIRPELLVGLLLDLSGNKLEALLVPCTTRGAPLGFAINTISMNVQWWAVFKIQSEKFCISCLAKQNYKKSQRELHCHF